jgi:hypothetical protein
MKLKKIIKEHTLGELPSSKLINEEYVESMNIPALAAALSTIEKQWNNWKKGPLTEPSDIKPAQKELMNYIMNNLKRSIK